MAVTIAASDTCSNVLAGVVAQAKKNSFFASPFAVLVSGPTCSGKTFLAAYLKSWAFAYSFQVRANLGLIPMDEFFLDVDDPNIPRTPNGSPCFDAPSSFHLGEYARSVIDAIEGKRVPLPNYSLRHNRRLPNRRETVGPNCAIVLGDGLYASHSLRHWSGPSIKIYLETPQSVCLTRRIERDTKLFGVSADQVRRAYEEKVVPYLGAIREQKKDADIVVVHST